MPIDITLAANTPTATLELRQAQATSDGAAFAAFLIVRSGGLAAALPFFVTRNALHEFLAALEGLANGASTPARLPAREGAGVLALEIAPDGRMIVSGELEEDEDQRLRFRFATDRQGAATLYTGLKTLLGAPGA
jgi:hypothetical protein